MAEPITSATASPVDQNRAAGVGVVEGRDNRGRKIYRIETEMVIEGRIQKPNAFVLFSRQGINYEWGLLQQGFTYRILDSVEDDPF